MIQAADNFDYRQWIDETLEACWVMDGYDDCIIGVGHQFGSEPCVVYDLGKVLARLMEDGMTYGEAYEWWQYNQVGAGMPNLDPDAEEGVSGSNPIFLERPGD